MKEKILYFTKNNFIRNIFILASGTALAQLINMLFSPLITRLYGPEAYGLMGTFTALVQILGPISALSYPIAIVLPKKDKIAKELITLSMIVTFTTTVLTFFILIFFKDFIVSLFNIHSISPFLYLLPVIVLFSGFLQVIEQWTIRKNNFHITARANIIETFFVNIGKFFIGLFYPSASILIFFTAIRQGVRAFLMNIYDGSLSIVSLFSMFKRNKKSIMHTAKKYKDFPFYRAPEVTLNALTENIPVLLLTGFFGAASAGFYSIARTVLAVPSTLIAKSVGDVFYPRVSQSANNKKAITPLILKSTFYLFLVGLIPYGIVVLSGPWLFSFVFGTDWVIAGEYARWVSFWSFFNFITKPSVQTLQVISAQKFQLIFTIMKLIVISLGFIIGFFAFDNDIAAVALFSLLGSLIYILLIIVTILKSKKFDNTNVVS